MVIAGLISWIIGILMGWASKKLYSKIAKNLIIRHRKMLYDEKTRKWIDRFYEKNGKYGDLYECTIGGKVKKIPYLSKWFGFAIDINSTSVIEHKTTEKPKFRISKFTNWKRKVIGQTLFDDEALYVYNAKSYNSIETNTCTFYEKLAYIDSIERETTRCSHCFLFLPRKRKQYFSSFDNSLKQNMQPMSIGCHVACVINHEGKKKICIEKRSEKVFTYGGYYAVLPVFGMVPIPNSQSENTLKYNVIKEYCEELFNVKELEHPANRPDPLWFYKENVHAKELVEQLDQGNARLVYLGFGIDALSGMSILSVLLYIHDEQLSEKVYKQSTANWEAENLKNGIEFVDISEPRIAEIFGDNKLQPGSAVAIDLSIKYLKKEGLL